MIETTVSISFVLLGAAGLIALWRVVFGPRILDRVIAYDTVAVCIVGMIVLLSIRWQTKHLIEIMLIFSLLGFMGSVAFVTYLNTVIPRQRESSEAWRRKKAARKREAASQSQSNRNES